MTESRAIPKLGNKFYNDLEGYISNLNAGHRGTGDHYAPGTEQHPAQIDRNDITYRLTKREANFLNAVINNQAAKAKSAEGLRELARAGGTLLTPEGETNLIRHAIDVRQAGIRQRLAERRENVGNPEIQEAAQWLWSQDVLEPTTRSFKDSLDSRETRRNTGRHSARARIRGLDRIAPSPDADGTA